MSGQSPTRADHETIEDRINALARAWSAGDVPTLDAFLDDSPLRPRLLRALILEEAAQRFAWGERSTLAAYRSAYPELDDDAPLQAAFEELLAHTLPLPVPADHRLGPYRLLRRLGEGSFAVVFHARDDRTGQDFALKLLLPQHFDQPDMRRRFLCEGRLLQQLSHPSLVAVRVIAEEAELAYLVCDLVDGTSLARLLEAAPPEARSAVRWLIEIAEAVEFVHRHGIVHRDIKPANILVDHEGRARLIDFGLARQPDPAARTQLGAVLGTPLYMAPEQALGLSRDCDARSDVFGLGATLLHVLSGKAPRPEVLDLPTEKLPAELVHVCRKAMAIDPAERYVSAAALASDLQRYLDGKPVRARPPGWFGRQLRRLHRQRLRLTVGVGLLFLFALLVVQLAALREDAVSQARERLVRARQQAEAARTGDLREDAATLARRIAILEEAVAVCEELRHRLDDDATIVLELARNWTALADLRRLARRPQGSETAADNALGWIGQFDAAPASRSEALRLSARSWMTRALTRLDTGSTPSALTAFDEARGCWRELLAVHPEDREANGSLAYTCRLIGKHRSVPAPTAEASEAYREARSALRLLLRLEPDDWNWTFQQALVCLALNSLEGRGEPDAETRQVFVSVHKLLERQQHEWPADNLRDLMPFHILLAKCLLRNGEKAAALRAFQECLRVARSCEKLHPRLPGPYYFQARAHYEIGKLAFWPADIQRSYEESTRCWRTLVGKFPDDADYRRGLNVLLHDLARVHDRAGRFAEAARDYREALELRERLHVERPDNAQYRLDVSATALCLGRLREKQGDKDAALAAGRRSLEQLRHLWRQGPRDVSVRNWLDERYTFVLRLCQEDERARLTQQRGDDLQLPLTGSR